MHLFEQLLSFATRKRYKYKTPALHNFAKFLQPDVNRVASKFSEFSDAMYSFRRIDPLAHRAQGNYLHMPPPFLFVTPSGCSPIFRGSNRKDYEYFGLPV